MTVFDEARDLDVRGERRSERGSLEKQMGRWGLLFISPWLIGFFFLTLLPMAASFAMTFTNFNVTQPDAISFIGLDNYRRLFTDSDLRAALEATFKFFLLAIPISIIQPILMAGLLNAGALRGRRFFTTLFYMTYMVPVVSAILIWGGMLNGQTGWINRFLAIFGVNGPDWLKSTTWVYPGLILIGLWGVGNAMLFTFIGMRNVPHELYEAAEVDGAGYLRKTWNITLPLITPIIFYNLVLSVIGLFQYFTIPYIVSRGTGEPGNATLFYNIHFYRTAFRFQDMGYGATLAWLLFAIVMIFTLLIFWSARYWVYSPGGSE
ncbi:MAG: sugar ABC transporter permease [Chloroflexota bacterium]